MIGSSFCMAITCSLPGFACTLSLSLKTFICSQFGGRAFSNPSWLKNCTANIMHMISATRTRAQRNFKRLITAESTRCTTHPDKERKFQQSASNSNVCKTKYTKHHALSHNVQKIKFHFIFLHVELKNYLKNRLNLRQSHNSFKQSYEIKNSSSCPSLFISLVNWRADK